MSSFFLVYKNVVDLCIEDESHGEEEDALGRAVDEAEHVRGDGAGVGLDLQTPDVDEVRRLGPGIVQHKVCVDHHSAQIGQQLSRLRTLGQLFSNNLV